MGWIILINISNKLRSEVGNERKSERAKIECQQVRQTGELDNDNANKQHKRAEGGEWREFSANE